MSFALAVRGSSRGRVPSGPPLVFTRDFENDFDGTVGGPDASASIITSGPLAGSKSARVAGGATGWGFQFDLGGAARTEIYFEATCRLNVSGTPSSSATLEWLKFGVGTSWQFILNHVARTDGTSGISYQNNATGNYTGSGTTQIPRGTSFKLQVRILRHATAGRVVIRVNGTTLHDFTGNTGTGGLDRINFLAQTANLYGATISHDFDNVIGAVEDWPVLGGGTYVPPPPPPPTGSGVIRAAGPIDKVATAGSLGFASPDTDFTWYDGTVAKAQRQQALGANMNRSDLRSNRSLSSYDALINATLSADQWMIGLIMGGSVVDGSDIQNLSSASRRNAFITWAVSCVNRWGAPGTGQIQHWQILNELNLNTKATPENYALLMPALYDAMKAADPDCFIIANGLSSVVDTEGANISTLDWTNRFMTALPSNRRGNCFDAWAQQPYTANVTPETSGDWQAWNQVDRNYNIMVNDYGVKKPVWLTEYGDPTAPSGGYAVVSEAAAATNIELAYYRACRTPWLGPLLIYSERDRPLNNGISTDSSSETFFGLNRRDGSQKPGAAVFQTLALRDYENKIGRPSSGTRQFWAGRYFDAGPVNFDLAGTTYSMTTRSGVSINASTGMLSITSAASTGTFTVTATLNGNSAQTILTIV